MNAKVVAWWCGERKKISVYRLPGVTSGYYGLPITLTQVTGRTHKSELVACSVFREKRIVLSDIEPADENPKRRRRFALPAHSKGEL